MKLQEHSNVTTCEFLIKLNQRKVIVKQNFTYLISVITKILITYSYVGMFRKTRTYERTRAFRHIKTCADFRIYVLC